jgi:hypothetical protein
MLPDPSILRELPDDDLPQPSTTHLEGASSTAPENVPVPTDSALRRLTVFEDKTVMISEDLGIGRRIRGILEDLITGGRGRITSSVNNADIFVCHWRDGQDYMCASRRGIDVGNLPWLYHVITNNVWTSPMRRLLHYPLPKDGIPGFKDYRITISNYGGEARTYLENLIQACGAEFTKSMKQDNTHLITARTAGEKCNAAGEWRIEIVNHLWVEECYAKCELQPLTNHRYTHFPPRTNLGEIIGQTQLDPKALERLYFPKDPSPSPSDLPARRGVMKEKDRNTPVRKFMEDVIMADQDDDAVETEEFPKPKRNVRAAAGSRARSSKTSLASEFSTPASNRRVSAGKENDTPSTGSRSAKDKALKHIHGLAGDIALYEKEKKRKGPVWGGERAANKIEKEKSLERDLSPADHGESDHDRASKRQKSVKVTKAPTVPPVEIRLLITSYAPWVDSLDKEEKDKVT